MDQQQNRNLLLAVVLSALVFVVWYLIFPPPEAAPSPEPGTELAARAARRRRRPRRGRARRRRGRRRRGRGRAQAAGRARPRVAIDTPALSGSLSLRGARLDDLSLNRYAVELGGEERVHLLTPEGSPYPYSRSPAGPPARASPPRRARRRHHLDPRRGRPRPRGPRRSIPRPPPTARPRPSRPRSPRSRPRPRGPEWDNGAGLVFTRTIAVDEDYMFTIADRVENTGAAAATLTPYAFVVRDGREATPSNYILHEGIVRMSDGTLQEIRYKDLPDLEAAPNGTARRRSGSPRPAGSASPTSTG